MNRKYVLDSFFRLRTIVIHQECSYATFPSPPTPYTRAQSPDETAPATMPSRVPPPGRGWSNPAQPPQNPPIDRSESLASPARAAPSPGRCRHGSVRSHGCHRPRPRHRAGARAVGLRPPLDASVTDAIAQSSFVASRVSANAFASAIKPGNSFRVASAKPSP